MDASKTSPPRRRNGDWDSILAEAKSIVTRFDTPVTLRQLHYQLVAMEMIRNTKSEYTQLSSRSAQARRDGWFPELLDRTRRIVQPAFWTSPEGAQATLREQYRRDRTEGQDVSIYLGVEKNGMVEQLSQWFGHELGLPILPCGGYSSESFERKINTHAAGDGRESVLLYGGDFDASGEDIERNLRKHTDFDYFHRIALTAEQVEEFKLPAALGKETDTRAKGFTEKYGQNVQVELDALPPDILRALFQEALAEYWDEDAYEAVLERETAERETL